ATAHDRLLQKTRARQTRYRPVQRGNDAAGSRLAETRDPAANKGRGFKGPGSASPCAIQPRARLSGAGQTRQGFRGRPARQRLVPLQADSGGCGRRLRRAVELRAGAAAEERRWRRWWWRRWRWRRWRKEHSESDPRAESQSVA